MKYLKIFELKLIFIAVLESHKHAQLILGFFSYKYK